MSRQTGELEKILAEQKEILRETDGIDRGRNDGLRRRRKKGFMNHFLS